MLKANLSHVCYQLSDETRARLVAEKAAEEAYEAQRYPKLSSQEREVFLKKAGKILIEFAKTMKKHGWSVRREGPRVRTSGRYTFTKGNSVFRVYARSDVVPGTRVVLVGKSGHIYLDVNFKILEIDKAFVQEELSPELLDHFCAFFNLELPR